MIDYFPKNFETMPYYNIPEGHIGRLQRKNAGDNELYIYDFSSNGAVIIIAKNRFSLIYPDEHFSVENFNRELKWVSQDFTQGYEIFIYALMSNRGHIVNKFNLKNHKNIKEHFLDNNIKAFTASWLKKDYKIHFRSVEKFIRHPQEQELATLLLINKALITQGKPPAQTLDPVIFIDTGWQQYAIDVSSCSSSSKSGLSLNAYKNFIGLKIKSDKIDPTSISTISFGIITNKTSRSELDKALELMQSNISLSIIALEKIQENAAETSSDFVIASYSLCIAYRSTNQIESAKLHIEKAMSCLSTKNSISNFNEEETNKLSSLCYVEYSRVHRAPGNEAVEEQYLNKALELADDNIYAHNALGYFKYCHGKFHEALSSFERAININQSYAPAYLNLGLLYQAVGEHNEAIVFYNKAIDLAPEIASYYSNRGLSYQAIHQYSLAEDDFEKSINLDPAFIQAQSYLALNYIFQGYPRKGLQLLCEINDTTPNHILVLVNLSAAYIQNYNYKKAIEIAAHGLTIDNDCKSLRINLVTAYLENNEHEKALDAWEELMKRSESSMDQTLLQNTHKLLAKILTLFKYYDEAIKIYESLLSRYTSDNEKANAYFLLGNLNFDKRDFEQAKYYYESANKIVSTPIFIEYINETVEAIKNPKHFICNSKNLSCDLDVSSIPDAQMQELEDKFNRIHLGSKFNDNVTFRDGLPYHSLLIEDDVTTNKSPTFKKLYLKDDGCWYYQVEHKAGYGSEKIANSDYRYNFIVRMNEHQNAEIIYGTVGHFYLSKQQEVIFAGEIWFKKGKIGMWNNASGHFKPKETLAPHIAQCTKLPLDKFIPLDKLQTRLLGYYHQYYNVKKIADIEPEKFGSAKIVNALLRSTIAKKFK